MADHGQSRRVCVYIGKDSRVIQACRANWNPRSETVPDVWAAVAASGRGIWPEIYIVEIENIGETDFQFLVSGIEKHADYFPNGLPKIVLLAYVTRDNSFESDLLEAYPGQSQVILYDSGVERTIEEAAGSIFPESKEAAAA